jgi:DNA-directed RNA polymerase specialized sigma24 family protein
MEWVHNAPTPPADDAGGLPREEIELATAAVGWFVSNRPWLREEREDLVQDCLEYWLRRRTSYDAARGASLTTFMRRVLERHLLDIEDKRTAEKRGGGRASLSLDREDEPGVPLQQEIAANENTEQAALFAIALDRARARLTPDQLVLADALSGGLSMSEVARLARRARSVLYADRHRIRQVFEDEGLGEFL